MLWVDIILLLLFIENLKAPYYIVNTPLIMSGTCFESNTSRICMFVYVMNKNMDTCTWIWNSNIPDKISLDKRKNYDIELSSKPLF